MNTYGLLIPALLAVVLVIWSFSKGGIPQVGQGFREGGSLFWRVLPNLLIGFTLAGFLMILIPQDIVARWIGEGSGFKGILIGSAAGTLTPGGPFTHFPILASLMGKGAALGPVSAYIAAWALFGVYRIMIWEVPILGWRFVGIRVLASLVFPLVIGVIAQRLAEIFSVAK